MISRTLADKLTEIALKQLSVSSNYKKPLMAEWAEYDDAYVGKVKPKFRQMFNIVLPVYSGMVDTLMADFDDPISLKFTENNPKDYPGVNKVNAAFQIVSNAQDKDSMWNTKLGWDRFNAINYGRGIQKLFCESGDGFKMNFNAVNPKNFHCQPLGGGWLENHLFAGEDSIVKTNKQLEDGVDGDYYDEENVDFILENYADKEFESSMAAEENSDFYSAFKARGLDPASNAYLGQATYNLCEWVLTYDGARFYLLFDPWTRKWVRAERLKDIDSFDLMPWTSWATHPHQKVFWSRCYGKDFLTVHDLTATFISQEATNRQKMNNGARLFDDQMIVDVSKLDKAQERPGQLVPVNTHQGSRKLSEAVYEITTPQLQATVNLIDWVQSQNNKSTGVYEIQNAGVGKGKANVQYTLLQQANKRLGSKARNFSQCYSELGLRFLNGLKENLTGEMPIKLMGASGYVWETLTREDLKFDKKLNVTIVNQTEQDKENVLGKDQKIQALKMLADQQLVGKTINEKGYTETVLKEVGGLTDESIKDLMDVQNFASKDVMAQADRVVQEMCKGKYPEPVYIANLTFLRYILDFVKTHKVTLKEKSDLFFQYIQEMSPIVMENMMTLAQQLKLQPGQQGQDGQSQQPTNQAPQSQQMPQQQVSQVANQQAPQVTQQPMMAGGNI